MTRDQQLKRLLVASALAAAGDLRAEQRANLHEAAALVLEGDDAEKARVAAFAIREAERCQLDFLGRISGTESCKP